MNPPRRHRAPRTRTALRLGFSFVPPTVVAPSLVPPSAAVATVPRRHRHWLPVCPTTLPTTPTKPATTTTTTPTTTIAPASRCPRAARAPIVAASSADGTRMSRGDVTRPADTVAVPHRKFSIPGVLFLIITYFWSCILFVPMMIAHPFVLWLDRTRRRFHDIIAMSWMRASLATVRVIPRVINRHNLPVETCAAVYVANHTSYLDIFTFAFLNRRIKYLSKAEIFKIPIIGWAMRMAGNVALLRLNRRGQMEAYRKMVNLLRHKTSIVIFPEGTRSPDGKLLRFQAGAFRAAKQQEVPVVPITIEGTHETMPSHAWVPLSYPPKPISLTVHPPLDSAKYSVEQLRDLSFQVIDSALPPEFRRDLSKPQ